jgi:hypothetical protein
MVTVITQDALLHTLNELQQIAAFQTPPFRHLARHIRRTIARAHVDHFAVDHAYLAALAQTIVQWAREHGVVLRDPGTALQSTAS